MPLYAWSGCLRSVRIWTCSRITQSNSFSKWRLVFPPAHSARCLASSVQSHACPSVGRVSSQQPHNFQSFFFLFCFIMFFFVCVFFQFACAFHIASLFHFEQTSNVTHIHRDIRLRSPYSQCPHSLLLLIYYLKKKVWPVY